jgi:hypothetical protein
MASVTTAGQNTSLRIEVESRLMRARLSARARLVSTVGRSEYNPLTLVDPVQRTAINPSCPTSPASAGTSGRA